MSDADKLLQDALLLWNRMLMTHGKENTESQVLDVANFWGEVRAYLNEKPHEPPAEESEFGPVVLGEPDRIAPPAAAEPEKPVAWMATNSRSKDMKWLFTDEASALDAADSMTGGTVTPLYAAVQQPTAQSEGLQVILAAKEIAARIRRRDVGNVAEQRLLDAITALDNAIDRSAEGEK